MPSDVPHVNSLDRPPTAGGVPLRSVVPRRRSAAALATVTVPTGRAFAPADVTATMPGLDALTWIEGSLPLVRELLALHGAVRIRGMAIGGGLGHFLSSVVGEPLLDYVNRSTPRQRVDGNVFTSTEYNADLTIPMHNEQSYTTTWPAVLGFLSVLPAASGGATPLVKSSAMVEALPDDIVARFEEDGVAYERWYHPHIDLSWQEVFQVGDRDAVTELCRAAGIESRWYADGTLWTREVAQATTEHPVTGDRVWFNQANLFHIAAHPVSMRQALRDASGGRPPRDARYGDGTPIPDSVIELINDTYARLSWSAPWALNDLMLIDNLAVAHGREPYVGPRRLLAAMAGIAGAGAAA